MDRRKGFIPESLYKEIIKALPIACVDVIVSHKGKFLLGKRIRKPAQGKWWFIGGRVLKGEKLERAAMRQLKGELGILRVRSMRQVGTKETIFKNSAFGSGTHTINTVFMVEVQNPKITKPKTSELSVLQWFSQQDPRWPVYIREMLKKAGF